MAVSILPTPPPIIFDDSRCTPDDTFATWFWKNRWPLLLASPIPRIGSRSRKHPDHNTFLTFAQSWQLTTDILAVDQPARYRCKRCGTSHTSDNPLLWGHPDRASAHQSRKTPPISQVESQIIYAQSTDIKSGDTDFSLYEHHTAAATVFCAACTLILSTRVMNYATDTPQTHPTAKPRLSFYWTPLHAAWPWDQPERLWLLPRERPLIFRAQSGSGQDNEKWATALTINWDPGLVIGPAINRKGLRGAYYVTVSAERLAHLPQFFAADFPPVPASRGKKKIQAATPSASRKKPQALTPGEWTDWLIQTLELPRVWKHIGMPWTAQNIGKALMAAQKEVKPPRL